MNFEEQKILVTGAAGFIGSHLVLNLLELGAEVVGLDNLYNGKMENLEDVSNNTNFEFVKGDIRDLNLLLEIMKDVDIIYHEAAFTSVPQSVKMPQSCNDVNINGTLNLLNAARKIDVSKIIFASSSSVYGDTPTLPKKEDMLRIPISPYGVTKLTCEAYMNTFYHVYGLKTISLRYFNVFGPRQKDSPYSGVIAIWLGRILKNRELIIFGDGEQSRDFTYVNDVVRANILAAESKISGEILNIGAGSPISLLELANLMLKITNKQKLGINFSDPRPGDILHSYADISKAKNLINFKPSFSPEDGLRNYFSWYKKKYNVDLHII
ncbi:MAG: SDR family oxidoreductase [Promethearchaeota archaeon]|jgi:nucleoside-diphosphate-sugar epimerase